jgi:hypothetical protein
MAKQKIHRQTFVGFKLEDDLLTLIDTAREFKDRSIFIREAVAEKLTKMGYTVQKDWVYKGRIKSVVKGNQTFSIGGSNSGTIVMGSQINEPQKKTSSH